MAMAEDRLKKITLKDLQNDTKAALENVELAAVLKCNLT